MAQLRGITLAYIGDDYLAAAEFGRHDESYFFDLQHEEGFKIDYIMVPVALGVDLSLQGTTDQIFSDGYEAANAVAKWLSEGRKKNPKKATKGKAKNPVGEGEWWIDDGGTAMFADSDVGDAGHIYYAFASLLSQHDVDLDDPNVPQILPMEPLSQEAFGYLRDEVGVGKELLEFLMSGEDPRDWALEKMGWIRVAGRNIQLWKLDSETVSRLSEGLFEAWDFDDPEEAPDPDDTVLIEELSTGRLYMVPATVIFDPKLTVAKIRKAARA